MSPLLREVLNFFRIAPAKKAAIGGNTYVTAAVSELDSQSKYLRGSIAYVNYDEYIKRRSVISDIEKLVRSHPEFSLSFWNVVTMGTRIKNISFDDKLSEKDAANAKAHLLKVCKRWVADCHSLEDLAAVCFSQLAISGDLLGEFWLKENLSGVKGVRVIDSKTLAFRLSKDDEWRKYQLANGKDIDLEQGYVSYYKLIPFANSPYGLIPFLAALQSSDIDSEMRKSILALISKFGLLGFLQITLAKPLLGDMNVGAWGNSDTVAYESKLKEYLAQHAQIAKKGIKDGVFVGFENDHNFNFQSTAAGNAGGVSDLVETNLAQFFAGLKTNPLFMGRNFNVAQTMAEVFLEHLSSQIKKYQSSVQGFLSEVCRVELLLAGFKVEEVFIEFDNISAIGAKSEAETEAISINNARTLFADGVISKQEYANRLGYEKAHNESDLANSPVATNQSKAAFTKSFEDYVLDLLQLAESAHSQQIRTLLDRFSAIVSQNPNPTARYVYTVMTTLLDEYSIVAGIGKEKLRTLLLSAYSDYKSTFEVPLQATDFEAIDFFEDFTDFYLGKFIKDESSQKRLFAVVKSFFEQNREWTDADYFALRETLSGVLIEGAGEWRLKPAINTALHNMRTIATIFAFQQKGIAKFKIKGVNDNRQCAFCSAMQDKTFETAKAYEYTLEALRKGRNYFVKAFPFINSTALNADAIKEASSDQLLKMGLFKPPFHPNCRDKIVEVI